MSHVIRCAADLPISEARGNALRRKPEDLQCTSTILQCETMLPHFNDTGMSVLSSGQEHNVACL